MSAPLIGLVGSGGSVGGAALALLRHRPGLRLRCGQRRPQAQSATLETHPLDVFDAAQLATFCEGCQVVLNCAGPSWLIGERVACAAHRAGAAYVDAFGNAALLEALQGADRPSIIGAGVFPGLTALLPRWLVNQGLERPTHLRILSGGREPCSSAGGADVLLSALGGFGTPNTHWYDGQVQALVLPPGTEELPGFPELAHRSSYLTNELLQLAQALELREASFCNVFSNPELPTLIASLCQRLSQSHDPHSLQQAVAQLVRAADLELQGRTPYYRLVVELEGWRSQQPYCQRAVLRSHDSYSLSATVAVCATVRLLEDDAWSGAHWAAQALQPATVIDAVLQQACNDLSLVELPGQQARNSGKEEGAL
ncbi:hypothetical protein DK254_11395 [Pseudomonas sp. RW407]|uniref:saccharopine dehydrogenase NADP-binding domain-containing protein n=1 Tax=Pseudomonas sp. RW407 TaxID=2202894 RepID=UPI000D702866|nr:saccharopine dehydrogenase NADP-binding domain-containing protein [Pseudomonas sp. RW407]PWU30669.1 hypothetical protein DK254_11395 [Pseudomonas sp. RW407]